MANDGRCGKELSPPASDFGNRCCWRPTTEGVDRCAWHSKIENKSVASLSALIEDDRDGAPQVCEPYLKNQTGQKRLSAEGFDFINPNFNNIDLFKDLTGASVYGGSLIEVDFFDADFENVTFEDVKIEESDFDRIKTNKVYLKNCIVESTSFTEFSAEYLEVSDCDFSGGKFSKGTISMEIDQTTFDNVEIRSDLDTVYAFNTKFLRCKITEGEFTHGKLTRCEVDQCEFIKENLAVDFQEGKIADTEFTKVRMNSELDQTSVIECEFNNGSSISKFELKGPCEVSDLSIIGSDTRVGFLKLHEINDISGLYLTDIQISEFVLEEVECSDICLENITKSIGESRCKLEDVMIDGGEIIQFFPEVLIINEVCLHDVDGFDLRIPKNEETSLNEFTITKCRLSSLVYEPSILNELTLKNSVLPFSRFQELEEVSSRALTGNSLIYSDFSGSDLSNTKLTGTKFFGSDLTEANLQEADIRNASFDAATLIGVDFRNARINQQSSFDDPLYLHAMADSRINGNGGGEVHRREKSGLKNRLRNYFQNVAANWKRLYHSLPKVEKEHKRVEQRRYLIPCIGIYRDLQRLHSQNGQQKEARRYRIRSREINRKIALTESNRREWMTSELFNRTMRYGESVRRLAVSSIIVVLASTALYLMTDGIQSSDGEQTFTGFGSSDPVGSMLAHLPESVTTALTSLYFSIITFTTLGYGDLQPDGATAKAVAGIEALFGVVLIAVLVFVLTRKATR